MLAKSPSQRPEGRPFQAEDGLDRHPMERRSATMAKMKAVQVPNPGADFEVVERETPDPGPGHVRQQENSGLGAGIPTDFEDTRASRQ